MRQSHIRNKTHTEASNNFMRYAYIKNGDAIDQLQRIHSHSNYKPTSGPDAFIFDFLKKIGDSPCMVLSLFKRGRSYTHRNIDARVFAIKGGLVMKMLLEGLASLKILLLLLRFKPDRIVCGVTGGLFWMSFCVARFYSIPFVHSEHNQLILPDARMRSRMKSAVNSWFIRKSGALVCHGPFLKDQLKSLRVPESSIFEFDVCFDDMLSLRSEHQTDVLPNKELVDPKIILYMGRIEADKGVFDLLAACSESLIDDTQLRLVYAGDGTQRQALYNEIKFRNLEKKVFMLGPIPHNDLVGLLKKSRVLAVPTQGRFPEGRCMSAMEGLVMGIPVIAPNFGPFPYLVNNEVNGLLYQVDSIAELKQKIHLSIHDDTLYEKLREGAQVTAKRLIHPALTFGEAIERAFAVATKF